MAYVVVRVKGKELHRVPLERPLTVGRGSACDLCVPEASLSREHCRLERRDGRWHVVDAGSRNGVRVRNATVPSAALGDGQRVKLGVATLVFHAGPLRPARPADPIVDKVMRMAAAAGDDGHVEVGEPGRKLRGLPRPQPVSRLPHATAAVAAERVALPQALPAAEETLFATELLPMPAAGDSRSRAALTATLRRWNGVRRSTAPVAAALRQKVTEGWHKFREEVANARQAA